MPQRGSLCEKIFLAGWLAISLPSSNILYLSNVPIGDIIFSREARICMDFDSEMSSYQQNKGKLIN